MESRKPLYNISMSRRTRKPQKSFEERENQKSLKQLIDGRCTLAQHFREEENQQQQSLVVRQPDLDEDQRLRLKRSIMKNYTRVLTHLIKVKQDSYFSSWRKSAVSFKLINHK